MANLDNGRKASHGAQAKKDTKEMIQKCEVLKSLKGGPKVSANIIETASCHLEVTLNNHNNASIYITSTWSLRVGRMDAVNTIMKRLKDHAAQNNKNVICILVSNCEEELPSRPNSVLLNAYNFEERGCVGIDVVVKTEDIPDVLNAINNVESQNDIDAMIAAIKDVLKKKSY